MHMLFTPGVLVSFCCITNYQNVSVAHHNQQLSLVQILTNQLVLSASGSGSGLILLRPR